MFEEDDLVPISALQHLIFCDRQAALIHLERIWMDNPFTVEGHELHRVVDEGRSNARGEVRVRRGVAIRSTRLGLTGKADVVEFHPATRDEGGVRLEGEKGSWKVVPVEYKRGKPKSHQADEVQLCAQAMCLEEMLETSITQGVLFYGKTRRRQEISLASDLRELTEKTARDLHSLIRSGKTPIRERQKKCRHCSLLPVCLPPKRSRPKSVRAYMSDAFDDVNSVSEAP